MPSLASVIARFTNQRMVYWEKSGSDSYSKPAYKPGVEIAVRWEDVQNEVLTPDGRKVVSMGYILLAVPVLVGSLVLLGPRPATAGTALAAWYKLKSYPGVPTVGEGAREIIKVNGTPDIKAVSDVYEAYI